MKLYLSSVLINFCHGDNPSIPHVPYLLGSFFYLRKVQKDKKAWVLEQISAQAPEDFLLDSGAFSFLTGTQIPDIDLYLEDYARFIKDNNIKQYFEMDIDSIVGLPKVEEYRKYLEKETGVPSIPVWHLSRGKEYFIRMCREYSYIALGGIASKEYGSKLYKYFPWFIKTAHENNCEIHGLGYTGKGLLKYRFDSVDSTSWLAGIPIKVWEITIL